MAAVAPDEHTVDVSGSESEQSQKEKLANQLKDEWLPPGVTGAATQTQSL